MLHPMSVDQSPVGDSERRGDERSEAPGSGGSLTGERDVAAGPPDPEVRAKPTRRRFSAEYRLRILKEADAYKKAGELGALLRREGLYSSHLITWRQQRERGALAGMRAIKRGPKARPVDPRVKQLEAENRRLQRKLQRAETIITLQKKVAEILGIPLKPLDNNESD
jgi:transposase